jgi:hypothetical protein
MKLIDNIEFSHAKEVVISRKVFYIRDGKSDDWVLDDTRTAPSTVANKEMPDCMSTNEMAEYVRDYIGIKKWKIVLSSGTINIFKKGKKIKKSEEVITKSKKPVKTKKNK